MPQNIPKRVPRADEVSLISGFEAYVMMKARVLNTDFGVLICYQKLSGVYRTKSYSILSLILNP